MLDRPEFVSFDLTSLRLGAPPFAQCPLALMQRVVSDVQLAGLQAVWGQAEASPANKRLSA